MEDLILDNLCEIRYRSDTTEARRAKAAHVAARRVKSAVGHSKSHERQAKMTSPHGLEQDNRTLHMHVAEKTAVSRGESQGSLCVEELPYWERDAVAERTAYREVKCRELCVLRSSPSGREMQLLREQLYREVKRRKLYVLRSFPSGREMQSLREQLYQDMKHKELHVLRSSPSGREMQLLRVQLY